MKRVSFQNKIISQREADEALTENLTCAEILSLRILIVNPQYFPQRILEKVFNNCIKNFASSHKKIFKGKNDIFFQNLKNQFYFSRRIHQIRQPGFDPRSSIVEVLLREILNESQNSTRLKVHDRGGNIAFGVRDGAPGSFKVHNCVFLSVFASENFYCCLIILVECGHHRTTPDPCLPLKRMIGFVVELSGAFFRGDLSRDLAYRWTCRKNLPFVQLTCAAECIYCRSAVGAKTRRWRCTSF